MFEVGLEARPAVVEEMLVVEEQRQALCQAL
jgi:hypothetical protein